MDSLLWILYECGMGLALLVAGPFLLARRGSHYLPALGGRLGVGKAGAGAEGPGAGAAAAGAAAAGAAGAGTVGIGGAAAGGTGTASGPLWLHAVSVGEVGVAATLARALPPELPLLVTTVTPTGQALARRLLGGRAQVAYLPFDLRPAVARFWRRFSPAALVLVEGDYWPLVLREARRRAVPVAVVNGRVGDRSFARMRRVRPLAARLFAGVRQFGMQTAGDRERLAALGVDAQRLTVTGNLKFDTAAPAERAELTGALRQLAGGRPVLVAGSTMDGEEEQVIDAFAALGGGRRALLLLAPRHPERWDEVERRLRADGLAVARRSALGAGGAAGEEAAASAGRGVDGAGGGRPGIGGVGGAVGGGRPDVDVVLLDSLGELAALYGMAAAVFIGGTLVPTGGHNPIEAALYGVPIAVGPSLHNFREVAEIFDRAGAWRRVSDAAGLAAAWEGWLADPAEARRQGARAAALLSENRGALGRTLAMLAPLLAGLAGASGAERAAAGEAGAGRAAAGAPEPAAAGVSDHAGTGG
jgi:3-deoxy-D-manno-octulosonic-acid transferase